MLYSQPTDEEEKQDIAKTATIADSWIHGLDGNKLKPMAKAIGRVVAATNYEGEANLILFAAWCDSIRSLMPIYDIPLGLSQVQAATWFLAGTAKQWWTGNMRYARVWASANFGRSFYCIERTVSAQ